MALTFDAFEGGQKRRFGYFSPCVSITFASTTIALDRAFLPCGLLIAFSLRKDWKLQSNFR